MKSNNKRKANYNVKKKKQTNKEGQKKTKRWIYKQQNTTQKIRAITKLANSEQSSNGKGKTHKYANRQNQSTTGKLGKP